MKIIWLKINNKRTTGEVFQNRNMSVTEHNLGILVATDELVDILL